MRAWLPIALLLAGCGGDDERAADAALDAAVSADAGADAAVADPDAAIAEGLPLVLGLGERSLMPVDAGDEAPLQRGCQGAQHIWVSLHAPTLAPGTWPLTLTLVRADGVVVVPPYTIDYDWRAADEGAELIGVTLVVFDPLAVVGELADIEATVSAGGETGRARLRVRVAWGPDAC
ncbi:MAG: hypothetical protein R3F65_07880 [bacterium]